jgi:NitT/TauT family transport system substrate-binding protein
MRGFIQACAVLACFAAGPAAAQTPLDVGVISRTVFYVPVWAAQSKGMFADAGLKVNVTILDNGETGIAGIKSGKLQVNIASLEGAILDAESGGKLRIVAGGAAKLPHYIIAQSRFKKIEDLKGATIGVVSLQEGTIFVMRQIGEKHGLKPSDYTIKAVGGAPTRWKLLKEGAIDAGLQPFPLSYEAEAAGFSNLGATFEYIPDWQFTSVNVDREWAAANRDTVERFLGALLRATAWMHANKDESAAIIATELRTSPEFAARAWDDTIRFKILPADMEVNRAGLVNVLASMQAAGVLPASAAPQPDKYLETSYLEHAWAKAR